MNDTPKDDIFSIVSRLADEMKKHIPMNLIINIEDAAEKTYEGMMAQQYVDPNQDISFQDLKQRTVLFLLGMDVKAFYKHELNFNQGEQTDRDRLICYILKNNLVDIFRVMNRSEELDPELSFKIFKEAVRAYLTKPGGHNEY